MRKCSPHLQHILVHTRLQAGSKILAETVFTPDPLSFAINQLSLNLCACTQKEHSELHHSAISPLRLPCFPVSVSAAGISELVDG